MKETIEVAAYLAPTSNPYNKAHQYVAFGHRTAFSRRCALALWGSRMRDDTPKTYTEVLDALSGRGRLSFDIPLNPEITELEKKQAELLSKIADLAKTT